jgi:hypothetical protein
MVDEVMMGLGACLLARTEEGRQHTEIRQEQEKRISDDHATTATPVAGAAAPARPNVPPPHLQGV